MSKVKEIERDRAEHVDRVQIVEGSSTSSIKTLRETLNLPAPLKFDLVFIDHLKVSFERPEGFFGARSDETAIATRQPLYTNDLKMMEDEGLVGPVSRCRRIGSRMT